MNKVILIGRLTRDPEVRWTTATPALCVAKFGIAVDRRVKSENEPQADFLNCTAFGKTAEHVEKYWKKGMKAAIEGRLQVSQYTDKAGQKRTDYQVVVEQIEFCEKKEQIGTRPADFVPGDPDEGLPFTF